MPAESINNQRESINQPRAKGGYRAGAGRPKTSLQDRERWFAARGIEPLHAAEILARVIDERTTWRRILNSEDDRVVLSALTFLVAMRDGKPAQNINVTSLGVTINASEIAQARSIVKEIMHGGGSLGVRGEGEAKTLSAPLMLSGGEGGEKGGG